MTQLVTLWSFVRRHKYLVVLLIFGVIIVFIDENSMIHRLEYAREIRRLKAEIENLDSGSKTRGNKVFRIIEYTQAGTSWTTVCFEVLRPKISETDGWYEVIKRKCAGTLAVDQFSEIGVRACGSVEEFMLKLEILG